MSSRNFLAVALSVLSIFCTGATGGQPALELSQARAASVPPDFSHRYVVFVDGFGSDTSSVVSGDFKEIQSDLGTNGMPVTHIVYFSYSAYSRAHGNPSSFCLGWQRSSLPACTGNLKNIAQRPDYSSDNTQDSIAHQAAVLDWLLRQIQLTDKSQALQIDVVTYSLGGVVTLDWAALYGATSPARTHLHSVTTMESPIGGLPIIPFVADSTVKCLLSFNPVVCVALAGIVGRYIGSLTGPYLPKQLQPAGLQGSIVPQLVQGGTVLGKNRTEFPVIQATHDYLVSGEPLPWIVAGITIPITPFGFGIQDKAWKSVAAVRHIDQTLGSKPVQNAIYDNVNASHHAPLHNCQTAQWVDAAISLAIKPGCLAPREPPWERWRLQN